MTRDERDLHRELRESLGAWVLGGLDGDERRVVADHVAACPDCVREVAALSPLPGLLGRLTEQEAAEGLLVPSERLRERLAAEVDREDARVRARLARWRTSALVAVAVAILAVAGSVLGLVTDAPTAAPSDRVVVAARPVSADAVDTSGEAAALDWAWGTTVEVDLAELPVRDTYLLWAVSEDGTRQRAGTWGATDSLAARVRGASSIRRDDLALVEVTDPVGTVLVRFTFPD